MQKVIFLIGFFVSTLVFASPPTDAYCAGMAEIVHGIAQMRVNGADRAVFIEQYKQSIEEGAASGSELLQDEEDKVRALSIGITAFDMEDGPDEVVERWMYSCQRAINDRI